MEVLTSLEFFIATLFNLQKEFQVWMKCVCVCVWLCVCMTSCPPFVWNFWTLKYYNNHNAKYTWSFHKILVSWVLIFHEFLPPIFKSVSSGLLARNWKVSVLGNLLPPTPSPPSKKKIHIWMWKFLKTFSLYFLLIDITSKGES